jgi:hypothetical protein
MTEPLISRHNVLDIIKEINMRMKHADAFGAAALYKKTPVPVGYDDVKNEIVYAYVVLNPGPKPKPGLAN